MSVHLLLAGNAVFPKPCIVPLPFDPMPPAVHYTNKLFPPHKIQFAVGLGRVTF